MKIPYTIDEHLVRGLDYYSHTVFELEVHLKDFGAQNVIGGGGRYDSMVEQMGGPATPGIGMAFGMERLLLASQLAGKIFLQTILSMFILSLLDKRPKRLVCGK